MRVRILVAAAGLLAFGAVPARADVQPVDPDLIPEARKVLEYLHSVYGRKVLSGMSSYGGWKPVYEVSGLAPAVYGCDAFGWNKPKWGESYSRVLQGAVDSIRSWWEDRGGIPTMQFHWGKPGDPQGSAWVGGGKGTGPVDVGRTVTPGTAEHAAAMDDLKRTADYLDQLAKARVPVLWRPFHEIDGGWFWWTDRQKPENTAALWRMMFDYFVRERKLHNLIWVYSTGLAVAPLKPGVSLADEVAQRKRYYPGDSCVDFVGIDIYTNKGWGYGEPEEDTFRKAYELMKQVAPGKMVGLTECAAIPDPDRLAKDGPGWLYALPWFTFGRYNSPEWIRKTFSHEHVLTLDELPALGAHNIAPDVRLLSPADGAEIAGDPVEVRAVARDRSGDLKGVEFFLLPAPWKNWFLKDDKEAKEALDQATRLGEGRLSPDGTCAFAWSNPPAGLHNLVAVARDRGGKSTLSNVARVRAGVRNLARGGRAQASSDAEGAAKAVDGDLFSSWNGGKEGEPWLAVDLGSEQTVGAVSVSWWKAYARSFQVQVSADGAQWKDVHRVDKKTNWHGDTDVLRFAPVPARHVRLLCTRRGTDWGGYTVYEVGVYASLPE